MFFIGGMMLDKIKRELGIPEKHSLDLEHKEWKSRGSEDYDIYIGIEKDENGKIIEKWEIKNSTEKYPPCHNYIYGKRLGI